MRRFLFVMAVLLAAFVVTTGVVFRHKIKAYLSSRPASPQQETDDLVQVKLLLKESKPSEALNIIDNYNYKFARPDDPQGREWLQLYIDAVVKVGDAERLLYLWETIPNKVLENETASLGLANVLLRTLRLEDYAKVRTKWQGHETQKEVWFVLDADRTLLKDGRQAAIEALNKQSFDGKKDVGRLIRLALLQVQDNPRMAWEYLTDAHNRDPDNVDVRSYRARLLEAVGKPGLALNEYLGAAQVQPDNLGLRDQLAEFYLRHGRYKLALKVWQESLDQPNSENLWLKTWFWNRVATPLNIVWVSQKVPDGELKPFLEYLFHLSPGTFWDQTAFDKLPLATRYLQEQQSAYWLRLLQQLENDNEGKAWELLQYNPFKNESWNPQLEQLVKRVLTYRKLGTFTLDEVQAASSPLKSPAGSLETIDAEMQKHPLIVAIEEFSQPGALNKPDAKIPEGLHALLMSKDAFSATFLAAGWLESALNLTHLGIFPKEYPEWYTYGITQAIRYNKGDLAALDFATKQIASPQLSMLIGELLVSSGSPDAGLDQLKKLSTLDSDIGFRSAWLASLLYIERQDYPKAREIVMAQPRLADNILGKETLARIALLEGKNEEADQMYSAIEKDSWEAKSYLARKAFQNKDWVRAKELTEQILAEFPNNELLRKNMAQILEELKKTNGKVN